MADVAARVAAQAGELRTWNLIAACVWHSVASALGVRRASGGGGPALRLMSRFAAQVLLLHALCDCDGALWVRTSAAVVRVCTLTQPRAGSLLARVQFWRAAVAAAGRPGAASRARSQAVGRRADAYHPLRSARCCSRACA